MYKCGQGHIFSQPVILAEDYWDRGEVLYGCPVCREGYKEIIKCKLCGRALEDSNTICYECAEELYTDRLGLAFIEKNNEFYLENRGIEKVDNECLGELIDDLREVYLNKIDMDTDHNGKLEKLKEYVLEDMDEWINFLEEEGEI